MNTCLSLYISSVIRNNRYSFNLSAFKSLITYLFFLLSLPFNFMIINNINIIIFVIIIIIIIIIIIKAPLGERGENGSDDCVFALDSNGKLRIGARWMMNK